MTFTGLASAPSDLPPPLTDRLRLAVAAYLARFEGSSLQHTESDVRCFLTWRAERGLDPLAAQQSHLERYIRWTQEIRRFKPSTVSRGVRAPADVCGRTARDARMRDDFRGRRASYLPGAVGQDVG